MILSPVQLKSLHLSKFPPLLQWKVVLIHTIPLEDLVILVSNKTNKTTILQTITVGLSCQFDLIETCLELCLWGVIQDRPDEWDSDCMAEEDPL